MTPTLTAVSSEAGPDLVLPLSYPPMLCATCASPIPDGGRFCFNCGADVSYTSSGPAALDEAGVAKLTRMLRQETAGEYEIEREIGRGGMGVVYLASEIQLRRRVAIKVLPPALMFGERTIQRFRREARTTAALDHPNIIPIYRVSTGGELFWYSMKLLEGKSLDVILNERTSLSFEETTAIIDQVADALDYAHRHGVIHRDVKPGNVLLDERGRVTVTDFGIAKEIQEDSVTTQGALLGSPYYMSPEQYVGGDIGGAADQYSLAVVAYQCLTGKVPFDAATAYELLTRHVTEAPPRVEKLTPGLPPCAGPAIERALAKQPQDRFPTVSDFASALAGRAPVVARRPRRRRRRAVAWIAGTALVAGGTYVLTVATPRLDDRPALVTAGDATRQSAPAAGSPAASGAAPLSGSPSAEAGSPAAPPAEVPKAVLIIQLTTGWARIYVDGELRGERPVHREQLPPGTHTLRFERPDFLPLDTTVTLWAGDNLVRITLRRPVP